MDLPPLGRTPIRIALASNRSVTGLLTEASEPFALLVLAPGIGRGVTHPVVHLLSDGLARRGVSVLRYNSQMQEARSRRRDPPGVAQAVFRSAIAAAAELAGDLPLFGGGRSFGGIFASRTHTINPLPGVRGFVFLGFPLHPLGKPSLERAEHLPRVHLPMLFLQGSRDPLAELAPMEALVAKLGGLATLRIAPEADHSFRIPVRSEKRDIEVMDELAEEAALWMRDVLRPAEATP